MSKRADKMATSSRRFELLTFLLVASQLSGCASLPTGQATAFKSLATGSQTSFTPVSAAETDALSSDQLGQVASHQKRLMLSRSCTAADSSDAPCYLVVGDRSMSDPRQGVSLISRTPQVQKLVAAISLYAGAMSDLATAKDLDAANAATGKATASLKALVRLVNPAVGAAAGPLIDGLAFGAQQLRIQQRRRLMLTLATAAQPLVDGAATALGEEATQLRGTLVDLREKRLMDAMQAFDEDEQKAFPSPAADRAPLITNISRAASDLSDARAIKTDFTALSKSHRAVLNALRDPHADVTTSVTEAQAFLVVLQSVANLKTPAAPPIT